MADKMIVKEPVFIQDDGQPVAVILPIETWQAYCAWLATRAEAIPSSRTASGFEREKAAFERLKPKLLQQYPNKYVAIVGGEPVEVGDDKIQVIERVHERFGRISMYVQQVSETPHVYHFPHRQVIHK